MQQNMLKVWRFDVRVTLDVPVAIVFCIFEQFLTIKGTPNTDDIYE